MLYLKEYAFVRAIAQWLRLGLAAQAPAVCFICWEGDCNMCMLII